jgi:hypothetical protein
MAYYRIYLLNDDNRICGVEEAECESDQSAIQAGEPLLEMYPRIEIWQEARRVAHLSPSSD